MYQQPMAERSSLIFNQKTNHAIDMITLSILFLGMFSCLIRSDYNFAIIFFCYFVWQQRKDALSLKIILASLIVLFIVDFIFMFTELRVWIQTDTGNDIWQTISPMHNFGIFCFALINLLKIVLTVYVAKGISQANKTVQTR